MDMDAFETYARQVTAELGDGWTAQSHETWSSCIIASHPDGRALQLWRQNNGEHLAAAGHYPSTDRSYRTGEQPETRAATSRSPRSVASQIAKRVLPQYAKTLKVVLDHNRREERFEAERRRVHDGLTDLVPADERESGSLKRPVIETRMAFERVDGQTRRSDRVMVSIEFRYLDEETARAVMQAYASARAASAAPRRQTA